MTPKANARDAAQTLNEPWKSCKDGRTVCIRLVEDDEISALSDEEDKSSSAYIKEYAILTSDKQQGVTTVSHQPRSSKRASRFLRRE
jgi:hypothetical protein